MKIEIDKKLNKIISDPRAIKKKFGQLSGKIKVALSILEVADNLEEVPNVPPTRRHKLSGNYAGCWAIDLDKSYRMIVRPIQMVDNPKNIKELIIIEIVDYH